MIVLPELDELSTESNLTILGLLVLLNIPLHIFSQSRAYQAGGRGFNATPRYLGSPRF